MSERYFDVHDGRWRYALARFFIHLGLNIMPEPMSSDLNAILAEWVKRRFVVEAKP